MRRLCPFSPASLPAPLGYPRRSARFAHPGLLRSYDCPYLTSPCCVMKEALLSPVGIWIEPGCATVLLRAVGFWRARRSVGRRNVARADGGVLCEVSVSEGYTTQRRGRRARTTGSCMKRTRRRRRRVARRRHHPGSPHATGWTNTSRLVPPPPASPPPARPPLGAWPPPNRSHVLLCYSGGLRPTGLLAHGFRRCPLHETCRHRVVT